MIVGVPKEIKENEYRVGMVPSGVEAMVKAGHKVLVEKMPAWEVVFQMQNTEKQEQLLKKQIKRFIK